MATAAGCSGSGKSHERERARAAEATSASSSASTSSSTAGARAPQREHERRAEHGTGGAGDGGSGATCLSATAYAGLFTIDDTAFCAVAVYTADEALSSQPSWGSHGGPLTMVADTTGGGVTLERWTAPAGAMGALTKATTHVAAGVPTGAYLNAQANDLPFFGWTAISWTGPGTATTGQIALIASGAVATTYTANGPYWLAGISDGASQGRLLFTGLSPLGAPTTDMNGLYAADACSAPMPELGAGTGCAASQLIDAWDEDSGPIALDKNGNAFVVLTSATDGNQEARGYAAAQVARGAPAVTGATLFTVDGFSGSLAALAPTASAPGLVVFEPFDATTYFALDVIEQAYTVTGDVVAASGTPTKLLTVPTMMIDRSLLHDRRDGPPLGGRHRHCQHHVRRAGAHAMTRSGPRVRLRPGGLLPGRHARLAPARGPVAGDSWLRQRHRPSTPRAPAAAASAAAERQQRKQQQQR